MIRGKDRMKKVFLLVAVALFCAAQCFAAGSVTQSFKRFESGTVLVSFSCIGDSENGSIPDTAMSTSIYYLIAGMQLLEVRAYPTSGGKAPDAADVFILDSDGEDLLGSADGGTTAGKGANLIHATLKKTTQPYDYHSGLYFYPAVTGAPTLKVSSQETTSADYTIDLVFK
jgi:hypothetical protein